MSVVSLSRRNRGQHQQLAGQGEADIKIRYRLFSQGREDWNRGLRELRSTIIHKGQLTRLADGTIRLTGLPSVDLRLDPAEVARARHDGLRLVSPIIEIEIDAQSFRNALSSLPGSADVCPFPRRT